MKKIVLKKQSFANLSFYIPWIFLVINTIIAQSYLEKYSMRLITVVGIAMFLFRIIWVNKLKRSELIWMIFLGILGLIIAVVSKDKRMLWLAIALSASIDIDFYRLVDLTFRVMLIVVFGVVMSCLLIYGNIGTSLKGGLALGMGHPSIMHGTVAIICMMFVYLKWDKLNFAHITVIEAINLFLYTFTLSRTGFASLSITLLLVLSYKIFPSKYLLRLIAGMTIIIAVVFTIIPIIYQIFPDNKWLILFDDKMTGRLWQSRWYYNISGIRFFGNYYEELYKTTPFALLDMGFFRLLAEYGIIAYLLIGFGYIGLIRSSIKDNNTGMFFLAISMIIFSCIESLGTYVFFNVVFISFGILLFKNNDNKIKLHIKIKKKHGRYLA